MRVFPNLIIEFFQNYGKSYKWPSEIMWSDNEVIYLMLYGEGDFICAPVGECLPTESICVKADFSGSLSLIKNAKNSWDIRSKNGKMYFASDEQKIKFVIPCEDAFEPNIAISDTNPIDVPIEDINYASVFTGREYPLNYVYLDMKNQAVFSSSGYQIFGDFSFKKPEIAIPYYFATLIKPNKDTLVYYDNSYLYIIDKNIKMKFKVFDPNQDVQVYYNLISKPTKSCEVNVSDLRDAIMPYGNGGFSDVSIDFKDNSAKLFASIGDNVAMQSTMDCVCDHEYSCKFNPRELQSVMKIMDTDKVLYFASHPKFDNIYMVHGGKFIFAVT